MKIKLFNQKKIVRFILLQSLMLLIYSYLFNKVGYNVGLIFSILSSLIFISLDMENKYYFILFSLPFASVLKINSSMPSMLTVYYIIFIITYLIKNSLRVNLISIIGLLGLVIVQFLDILIYNASISGIVSLFLNIIFVIVVIEYFKKKKKVSILKNSGLIFSVSMILSITIADLFPNIPFIVLREKQELLTSVNRFCGLNGDPNYYSQLVLIAISLLIGVIKYEKKKNYKIIEIGMIAFLLINGLRSISKSYAITLIVLFIIYAIYEFRSASISIRKSYLNILATLFGVSIMFIILLFLVFGIVIPLIESRTDSGDLFTGRTYIWRNYLKLLFDNPEVILCGVGFSNGSYFFGKFFGSIKAAHNAYIDIIMELGILGIIFLTIILKDIIFNFKKILSNIFSMYLFMIFFTSFGLSFSSNDAVYILIPISLLIIKINNELA